MFCCKGPRVQRRTVRIRTKPGPGLIEGLEQVGVPPVMSKVQVPALSLRSVVQIQSVVLVVVLLGSLGSVEGFLMEDQEELLVELHNRYRGVVQPSASAMIPLKWDGNLKLVAEAYAAKCIWNHNSELEDTGENLFAGTGVLDLERAMEKWFLERMDYTYDNNSCDEDKMCGHYTQMVWADTHRVGCAVHLCAQMEGLDWTEPINFLVCNYYPPGNYEGERPYVEGEWCSQCPENLPRCVNNLCAPEAEPTETEPMEEPTEAEPAPDSATPSDKIWTLPDLAPGTDQAPVSEQDPDQGHEEQEAVVPPPATESIPPEPQTTHETETVTETKPRADHETRPEPEVARQPEPPVEKPTGGPTGGAAAHREKEQKIVQVGGKAPPTHALTPPSRPQTPPPENRGQKQIEVVEKHRRAGTMASGGVALSGCWSLVFLWICLPLNGL